MADAEHLVRIAESFTNQRSRAMRSELRNKLGEALRIPVKNRVALDCIESNDAFVVIKPDSRLVRDHFDHHDPLLRQAIVAACAALETYLVDAATQRARAVFNSRGELPPRLRDVTMTLAQWQEVEGYTHRRRGVTEKVFYPHFKEFASTAHNKVGQILSTVGIAEGLKLIDRQRGVGDGTTKADLDRMTARRNKIAHDGDRQGRGRAPISSVEVHAELATIRSIVDALDVIFRA